MIRKSVLTAVFLTAFAPLAAHAGGLAGHGHAGAYAHHSHSNTYRAPQGYRAAWDDGRLNPLRGKQTFRGARHQALIWTQTVPRRLKDERGRDVTTRHNFLVYPYTDYRKQQRDLGTGRYVVVYSNGQQTIVER